jgi:hypothetical protein
MCLCSCRKYAVCVSFADTVTHYISHTGTYHDYILLQTIYIYSLNRRACKIEFFLDIGAVEWAILHRATLTALNATLDWETNTWRLIKAKMSLNTEFRDGAFWDTRFVHWQHATFNGCEGACITLMWPRCVWVVLSQTPYCVYGRTCSFTYKPRGHLVGSKRFLLCSTVGTETCNKLIEDIHKHSPVVIPCWDREHPSHF